MLQRPRCTVESTRLLDGEELLIRKQFRLDSESALLDPIGRDLDDDVSGRRCAIEKGRQLVELLRRDSQLLRRRQVVRLAVLADEVDRRPGHLTLGVIAEVGGRYVDKNIGEAIRGRLVEIACGGNLLIRIEVDGVDGDLPVLRRDLRADGERILPGGAGIALIRSGGVRFGGSALRRRGCGGRGRGLSGQRLIYGVVDDGDESNGCDDGSNDGNDDRCEALTMGLVLLKHGDESEDEGGGQEDPPEDYDAGYTRENCSGDGEDERDESERIARLLHRDLGINGGRGEGTS